jgi:hypothetical protein
MDGAAVETEEAFLQIYTNEWHIRQAEESMWLAGLISLTRSRKEYELQ